MCNWHEVLNVSHVGTETILHVSKAFSNVAGLLVEAANTMYLSEATNNISYVEDFYSKVLVYSLPWAREKHMLRQELVELRDSPSATGSALLSKTLKFLRASQEAFAELNKVVKFCLYIKTGATSLNNKRLANRSKLTIMAETPATKCNLQYDLLSGLTGSVTISVSMGLSKVIDFSSGSGAGG